MKKRTNQNRTGNAGITAIRQYCDRNSLIFQAEPREDFGIDCYIELEHESLPQNFIIGIQAKSGPSYKKKVTDQGFSVYLSQDDISYWLAANYPVFFVYYDIERDRLYFKHVQAELDQYADISECNQFLFSESDSAENGQLAEYAHGLLRKTPNFLNRLEVASTNYPVLLINDKVYDIFSFVTHKHSRLEIGSHFPEIAKFPPTFPWWSGYRKVIGYSDDGKWICEFNTKDASGPTHKRDTYITFLNTGDWTSLQLSLFECSTCEHAGYLEVFRCNCQARFAKQLHKIQQIVQHLNIMPATQIYEVYDLYDRDQLYPDMALLFGCERFDLELVKHNGRDALSLNNRAYWPQRSISVLIERVIPAPSFLSNQEECEQIGIYTVPQARRFESITEVSISGDGQWITFSIITNTDHSCLGFPWTHLVHLRMKEIQELCIKALVV